MYRVTLTAEERRELIRRAHEPGVKPRTRDRLEMVRLNAAGMSIPEIARHLEIGEACVRFWIKRYIDGGFDSLPDRPHPGLPCTLTPAMIETLREELRKGERTWTAAQLAAWVAQEFGVQLSADRLSRLLKRAKIRWKRTSRSLKHKQDPEVVADKRADLETLEKGGRGLDRCLPPGRSRLRDDPAHLLQLVYSKGAIGGAV